ncbi:UDP-N-acetylmuramate--L-alanine ligase [Candidatus Parcubacteria bacterium]|nr:MAG: UDP-N-acetylmuramate--L-alanine ligase [Candidatus Parcubacteria bacterium]
MKKIDIENINKVYLSGVGGIGLSAIAYYFLNLDKKVLGSDIVESEVTRRLEEKGMLINFKQKANNLTSDIDLLVYSSALPDDHEELKEAKRLKIKTMTYFEFLGCLSRNHKTIAVTGTNGKTTTTAMIGLALEKAGLDPTVIVGSLVSEWGSNFRLGKSDILVVEACEWQAHMLEIDPQMIVLTNVAEDHLDYYKDLDDIKRHFQKFVDKLPKDGILFKNIDDKESAEIKFSGQTVDFGKDKEANYYFDNPRVEDNKQHFDIYCNQEAMVNFSIQVPGLFNLYNATATIAVCDKLGVNRHQIWNALNDFPGTWRRFELVGQMKSNVVISDYAHHPDSINQLLRAAKDFYPDKKLIAVFQPHHHNRTKTLLAEFAKAFYLADQVIINEVYHVSGREDKQEDKVSGQDIIDKMHHSKKYFAPEFSDIKKIIKDLNPINSVILFIGAGDIDNLAREIID